MLRNLYKHDDARVRVEAIRGLAAIDGDATVGDLVAAFADPDRRVRQVAVSLMRACPSPEIVTRLTDVVVSGKVGSAEAERLVEVIGERKDAAAGCSPGGDRRPVGAARALPRAPGWQRDSNWRGEHDE